MRPVKLTLAAFAVAALFALGACGGGNNVPAPTDGAQVPSPTAGVPPTGGEIKEVTINASNFKFEPEEIRAKVGDTLKITLNNTQGVHGVGFSDFGVDIKQGETKEITLDRAGNFEYHCSIQCGAGHDSMTGFIVVE